MKVTYEHYLAIYELCRDGVSARNANEILPLTLSGTKSLLAKMVKSGYLTTTKHYEKSVCHCTYWQSKGGKLLLDKFVADGIKKIEQIAEKKKARLAELSKRDSYQNMTDAQINGHEARQNPKKFSVENAKHETSTGYIVKGFDGFHSGNIERARQRVFANSSCGMV